MLKLYRYNQFFNLNKLKKYCIVTGRLRFIINKHKFSRIIFREYTAKGYIAGYYKI